MVRPSYSTAQSGLRTCGFGSIERTDLRVCPSLRRTQAMPGHPLSIFKDSCRDLSPLLCAKCRHILDDPVSFHSCNCRVCATCADSAIDHRAGKPWCQLCGEELEQRSGKYVSALLHACMHACMVPMRICVVKKYQRNP